MRSTGRAFTLIEIVLSLALLAGMMAVLVPWSVSAARHAERTQGLARWESAALRTLDLIERDLTSWDAPLPDPSRRARPSRGVTFDDRSIRVPIRAEPWASQAWAEYVFDPDSGRLERTTEPGSSPRSLQQAILGELNSFRIERTQVDQTRPSFIIVSLRHRSGLVIERVYPTDEETQP